MYIVLMSYEYSAIPPIIIEDRFGNNFSEGSPRIEKVPLISGGNYFHIGSDYQSDREFTITGRVTLAQAEHLRLLKEGVTKCKLVTYREIFSGYIQALNTTRGELSLTFWPDAQLAGLDDVSSPGAPAVDPWLDRTSDTYWDNFVGSPAWDGSSWVFSGGNSDLYWKISGVFQPQKIRITYTGDPITNIEIREGDAPSGGTSFMLNSGAYSSLDEISLGPYYRSFISELKFSPRGNFSITKIEYLE